MKKYIYSAITTLTAFALIIVFNFALPRMLTGDPVAMLTGLDEQAMTEEMYQYYYHALGLDLPLHKQFAMYLGSIADGTLGYSYHYNSTVAEIVAGRIGVTIQIALPAVVISSLIALWIGLYAGSRPLRLRDSIVTNSAVAVNALPSFVIAMLLLATLAYKAKLFPLGNLNSVGVGDNIALRIVDRIWHLALPVATLVLASAPSKILYVRNLAAREAHSKYILFARARGLSEHNVRMSIAANIIRPIVAMTGISFGAILGGSVVVETLFSIPGMGMLVSDAVNNRDYPTLQGCLFVICACVVVFKLVADIFCIATSVKRGNAQ